MVNYKHPSFIFGEKNIERLVANFENLKVLAGSKTMDATLNTFEDCSTGVNYQVPSGKTFYAVLGIVRMATTEGYFLTISSATSANSNTGEILRFKMESWNQPTYTVTFPPDVKATENTFLGQKSHTTTNTQISFFLIYGYEE